MYFWRLKLSEVLNFTHHQLHYHEQQMDYIHGLQQGKKQSKESLIQEIQSGGKTIKRSMGQ